MAHFVNLTLSRFETDLLIAALQAQHTALLPLAHNLYANAKMIEIENLLDDLGRVMEHHLA